MKRQVHTYPTKQIHLVQINHHVQVERAGQVLMVQVPDQVSHPRGPGKVDTGNAADRQRELEDQPSDDQRIARVTRHGTALHCIGMSSPEQYTQQALRHMRMNVKPDQHEFTRDDLEYIIDWNPVTGLSRNIPMVISRGIRVNSERGFRLPKGAFRWFAMVHTEQCLKTLYSRLRNRARPCSSGEHLHDQVPERHRV